MGLFDGMGTLITATFGGTVSVTVPGYPPADIIATFREGPTTVLTEDGAEVVTVMPTLYAPRPVLAALVPDTLVRPGNGLTYRCIAPMPSGSPAADALVTWQLERTDAS
jgi:hypothetical protein